MLLILVGILFLLSFVSIIAKVIWYLFMIVAGAVVLMCGVLFLGLISIFR